MYFDVEVVNFLQPQINWPDTQYIIWVIYLNVLIQLWWFMRILGQISLLVWTDLCSTKSICLINLENSTLLKLDILNFH